MRRVPELDALRGLAALAIVAHHLWVPGWGFMATAVDLFFVMSGFLITSIILKQLDRPAFLTTFYARRALRIWPIYYLSLLGFIVLNAFLPAPARAPLDALPYYLTYTQRIPSYWAGVDPAFSPCFGHTWTLAIEEQFYLIWPLLIFVLGRRSVLPAALAMITLAVVARGMGYSVWILLTRCDGLALGGLLALVFEGSEQSVPPLLRGRTLALIGAGAVVFLANGSSVLLSLGLSDHAGSRTAAASSLRFLAINLMYFGLVGATVSHAGARWLAPLRARSLCFLGQISYGLYLYHYLIFGIIDQNAGSLGLTDRAILDPLKLTVSFAVAVLSWRFIERPLLARKEAFACTRYREPDPPRTRAVARVQGLQCDGS